MSGRTILVTRPRADAERTAAGLSALGLVPIVAPLLEARFFIPDLPETQSFSAIAFTSANAVRALAAHPAGERFAHLPVFAVGDHTAREAEAAGFSEIIAAGGTLDDLVATILTHRHAKAVFYPAPNHQSGNLAGLLAAHGIASQTAILYDMQAATALPPGLAQRLLAGGIDGALFYSRRTAQTFVSLLADPQFDAVRPTLHCLAMSEKIAEPLLENHFLRIGLADAPSNDAMMMLALAFARDEISP